MVGVSGSGESPMAKLLLKYYEPEEGEITIDGVDIAEYANDSLRKGFLMFHRILSYFQKVSMTISR